MHIEYLVRYETTEERARLIMFLQKKGYIYVAGADGCEYDQSGTIDLYYWDQYGSHAFFIGKEKGAKVFSKARPAFAAAFVSSKRPGHKGYLVSEFIEKLGHSSVANDVPAEGRSC